jgi:glycine cleavage system H protein
MNIPQNLKYTKDHEWILVEGNKGTIGITEYAQGELGDIVFVDIDPNKKELFVGQSFGTVEAVKTVSDLYAPCSGILIEQNKKLADEPQLINSDPYGEGWLIKIEISNPGELNNLLESEAYRQLIGQK